MIENKHDPALIHESEIEKAYCRLDYGPRLRRDIDFKRVKNDKFERVYKDNNKWVDFIDNKEQIFTLFVKEKAEDIPTIANVITLLRRLEDGMIDNGCNDISEITHYLLSPIEFLPTRLSYKLNFLPKRGARPHYTALTSLSKNTCHSKHALLTPLCSLASGVTSFSRVSPWNKHTFTHTLSLSLNTHTFFYLANSSYTLYLIYTSAHPLCALGSYDTPDQPYRLQKLELEHNDNSCNWRLDDSGCRWPQNSVPCERRRRWWRPHHSGMRFCSTHTSLYFSFSLSFSLYRHYLNHLYTLYIYFLSLLHSLS